jgi:hypothetical protein
LCHEFTPDSIVYEKSKTGAWAGAVKRRFSYPLFCAVFILEHSAEKISPWALLTCAGVNCLTGALLSL